MTKAEITTVKAGQKVLVAHSGKVYEATYERPFGARMPTQHFVFCKYDTDEEVVRHRVGFSAIKFAPKAEPKAKAKATASKATPKAKAATPKAEPLPKEIAQAFEAMKALKAMIEANGYEVTME